MSSVSITSLGTSPGVTTTVLALAAQWTRNVIVVEADVSKPASIVTGYMQGSLGSEAGLMGLAQASLTQRLVAQDIWDFAIPLHPRPAEAPEELDKWLLANLPGTRAARGSTTFWSELMIPLTQLGREGTDTLIDLGRAEIEHGRTELITTTDHLLVTVRSDLTSVAAAKEHLPGILSARAAAGMPETTSLLILDDATQKITPREITKYLGLEVTGRMPYHPKAAAHYAAGASVSSRTMRSYIAAATATASALQARLRDRRALLEASEDDTAQIGEGHGH